RQHTADAASQRGGGREREQAGERSSPTPELRELPLQGRNPKLDGDRSSNSSGESPSHLTASLVLSPGRSRSGAGEKVLLIPPRGSKVLLVLLVNAPPYENYSASLRAESGAEIWTASDLKPQRGDHAQIRISPPVDVLSPGDYRLTLRGSNP